MCTHGDVQKYPKAEVNIRIDGRSFYIRVGALDNLPVAALIRQDLLTLIMKSHLYKDSWTLTLSTRAALSSLGPLHLQAPSRPQARPLCLRIHRVSSTPAVVVGSSSSCSVSEPSSDSRNTSSSSWSLSTDVQALVSQELEGGVSVPERRPKL